MKIGLRTIKTAIAAPIALMLANMLGLESATAAAIITVLSVTNTKRSTAKTAVNRVVSLTLATAIAALFFSLFGFTAFAFGLYLLLFIPLSVQMKIGEGISVSSVLITHYLASESLAPSLILNEYLLMIIGVGCALVANLYMPNTEKKIKEDQQVVEVMMKKLLSKMSDSLNQITSEEVLIEECQSLAQFIKQAQKRALQFEENRLWSPISYYFEYFAMRRLQVKNMSDMLQVLIQLDATESEAQELHELFDFTAETLAEDNDGQEILRKIEETYQRYREKELPENRQAFENRAMLFHLFQLFQDFIEIKAGFYRDMTR
ncbi:aromatic acid exporter family protein [Enterococcus sp. 669A]|uniref:Aromatic acid exporter family protein n=1 Tax=Candidatus Enterococcus moelleringii TaxID=2815325 RepID=A0ABS3LEX8_9ENTE|nr:aromatic acid exporter family protein [Enterococcus sp. 669A]MBO1307635.1 aromatic acid exporter family protein [Enterococcus sp. 669A]